MDLERAVPQPTHIQEIGNQAFQAPHLDLHLLDVLAQGIRCWLILELLAQQAEVEVEGREWGAQFMPGQGDKLVLEPVHAPLRDVAQHDDSTREATLLVLQRSARGFKEAAGLLGGQGEFQGESLPARSALLGGGLGWKRMPFFILSGHRGLVGAKALRIRLIG